MLMEKQSQALQMEIAQLEGRLQDMRAQLDASTYPSPPSSHPDNKTAWTMPTNTSMHTFLTNQNTPEANQDLNSVI